MDKILALIKKAKNLLKEKKSMLSKRDYNRLSHFIDIVEDEIKSSSILSTSVYREIQLENIIRYLEKEEE